MTEHETEPVARPTEPVATSAGRDATQNEPTTDGVEGDESRADRESHDEAVAVSFDFEPTGNEVVDSVLASLAGLDGVPVAERVAVFESAHDRLRGALAEAGRTSDS